MSPIWEVFFDLWPEIASVAWGGFRAQGRGAVFLEVGEDSVTLEYRTGAPCDCHAEQIESYDPASESVVVLAADAPGAERAAHRVQVLKGWPAPPDAAVRTAPPRLGHAAH